MRSKVTPLLMAGALAMTVLGAVTPSSAGTDSEAKDRARLEQRADHLESRLRGKTGGAERQEINRQRREIDDVIRRIQAGEAVDPKEIDRILGDIPLD